MKYILFLGFILLFVACGQKKDNINNKIKETETHISQNKDSVVNGNLNIKTIHKSDFDKFLKDPNTPKMAVELYLNTYKLKDDEPLELLKYLDSGDVLERWFYFRVITNSYKISDSSFAEGLGASGKEYIENKTHEFASYFDNKECFSDKDLETWADIAMLEFGISGEINDGVYDKTIVATFNKKLKENCKDCQTSQKETIDKFCKVLENKYNNYIHQ